MRRISPLEQEYRQLKRQDAPELWDRIEGGLKEHPERETGLEWEERQSGRRDGIFYRAGDMISRRTVFAAAAAALLLMMIPGLKYSGLLPGREEKETDAGRYESVSAETMIAAETTAFDQGSEQADGAAAKEQAVPGVLTCGGLNLEEYRSLPLPSGSVTVAEDSMYFSEELLGDTELLCLGTVTEVSLEDGPSGNPCLLVYEIRVDSVCYSSGYTTGLAHVQVKSPIVSAVGGESQILYQLQAGSSYVLSLKCLEDVWELVFPLAPQIQVVPGGGYLFHSGYMSLTNKETLVVAGRQEGVNDFYYDRMLFRDDDEFLSDLISLVVDRT